MVRIRMKARSAAESPDIDHMIGSTSSMSLSWIDVRIVKTMLSDVMPWVSGT